MKNHVNNFIHIALLSRATKQAEIANKKENEIMSKEKTKPTVYYFTEAVSWQEKNKTREEFL